MNSRFVFSTLIAMAMGLPLGSPAKSQVTIDASKITCEDYVFYKISNPNAVAHWLSGYYHGKANDPMIYPKVLGKNAEKLRSFCKQSKNYKMPLMEAIEKHLIAPKPR